MLSHFGSEHYCPLSLLRVYGSSMMEELEDHETDGQEDTVDTDSDVQVLPPKPGANVEDDAKKPNLLERAADTVISLVKKFTGNGHDKEKGPDVQEESDDKQKQDTLESRSRVPASMSESQDENKGKIVTLVGHEELKEEESNNSVPDAEQVSSDKSTTSQGKAVSVNMSSENSSLCNEMSDQRESNTTSIAPSSCHLFSQVIGQYSLGCFMGRLLFSKNKDFTLLLDVARRGKISNKTSPSSGTKKRSESFENKVGSNQEEVPKHEEPIQEKPSVSESSEETSTPSEATNQKSSVVILESSSSNVELKIKSTVSEPLEVTETTDSSSRIVQPSQSTESEQKSEVSDDKTPALAEVTVVTSVPLSSAHSASSSVALESSEVPVLKESNADAVKEEPSVNDQPDINEQPVQQGLPSGQSTVLDGQDEPAVTKDSPQQPLVPIEVKDVTPKSEEQKREENLPDKDKKEGKEQDKPEATPSECSAPNSIHMMSQSSDIDILETKLTDKDGREGTAQLPEEANGNVEKDPLSSGNEASTSKEVTDSSSMNLKPVDSDKKEAVSPEVQNQESNNESTTSSTSTVESQSVDPPVQPTSPPSIDTADLSDSVVPLPAPPVVANTGLSSQEVASASSESNLDAAMLGKSQQAATTSAGMASVVGSGVHKESIFVRLSNKVKALEQNMNMSTLYMEQLNQRYEGRRGGGYMPCP